jgi:hypothetical protein
MVLRKWPTITLLALLALHHASLLAQSLDSTKRFSHFAGSVGLTNNGIALVPTFSLEKPAAIMTFSLGTDRFSFEPDIRYTLDFKRGGMALFFRYRLPLSGRFQLGIGGNPAYNFVTKTVNDAGTTHEIIEAQRFVGGEIAPNYIISKHLSLGMYYLYGHGFQSDAPVNLHFLTLNASLTNILVAHNVLFQIMPQVYYLNQDGQEGYYFTATGGFYHKKYPFSLSSTINAEIKSHVSGSKPFAWNITLLYSFSKTFGHLKR